MTPIALGVVLAAAIIIVPILAVMALLALVWLLDICSALFGPRAKP